MCVGLASAALTLRLPPCYNPQLFAPPAQAASTNTISSLGGGGPFLAGGILNCTTDAPTCCLAAIATPCLYAENARAVTTSPAAGTSYFGHVLYYTLVGVFRGCMDHGHGGYGHGPCAVRYICGGCAYGCAVLGAKHREVAPVLYCMPLDGPVARLSSVNLTRNAGACCGYPGCVSGAGHLLRGASYWT